MRLILEPVVRAALLEDLGRAGDITTGAVVPAEATVEAVIAARQPGVLAGLDAALLSLIDFEAHAVTHAFSWVIDGARSAFGNRMF
jgi:nicotinate-nucleotide pyrophosphorylase